LNEIGKLGKTITSQLRYSLWLLFGVVGCLYDAKGGNANMSLSSLMIFFQLMEILGLSLLISLSSSLLFDETSFCVNAASSSLDRANVPIVDREALLRKAVLASLEDRTAPSWNQLIPNLDHLAAGLLSRQDQRAPSNGHAATDLSIETQYLLSRLAAGSSPEALALLLQSNGQLSTASRHAQDAPGSHPLAQEAAAGPVLQQTHASSSAPDSLRMQACPSQRLVGNSSCGHAAVVSTPVPDSPHVSIEPFIRSTDSSSLARPIAERPMLNPDRLALQVDQAPPATPTVQRLFPQQSTANRSTAANGNNASWRTDAGMSSAIGSRGSSMVSSFGTHETRPSLRPIPADPRPAVQQPAIVQLSDSSQSGSDEQLPVLSSADSEVAASNVIVLFGKFCLWVLSIA
jgi:hypothetical protein